MVALPQRIVRVRILVWLAVLDPFSTMAAIVVENAGGCDPYQIQWAASDKLLVTKSRRGEVRVWHPETGTMLQALPAADEMGTSIQLNDKATLVATSRVGYATVTERLSGKTIWQSQTTDVSRFGMLTDRTITLLGTDGVRILDYRNNKILASWKLEGEGFCYHLGILGKGRIAVALSNRNVVILDENTLTPMSIIKSALNKPFYGASFASKGSRIALATFNGVTLADSDQPLKGYHPVTGTLAAYGVALSETGDKIAIGTPGGIEIRNSESGEVLLTRKLGVSINSMAWTKDDSQLAIASSDHGILVINAATGDVIRSFGEPVCFDQLPRGPNCAVSNDGRVIALIDEKKRLTTIDLAEGTSTVAEFGFTDSPDAMGFDPGNLLLVHGSSSCVRFNAKGERLGSIRIEGTGLGGGLFGSNGSWLRSTRQLEIFKWNDHEAVKTGSFPLEVGQRCEISRDGALAWVRENDDPMKLIIRKAPAWDIQTVAEKVEGGPAVGALIVHEGGRKLSWIDDNDRLVSYDVEANLATVMRELPRDSAARIITSNSVPDWFVCSPILTNPPSYRVVSANSGETVFESQKWDAFEEEVDLVPVNVTPDGKHLWLCGPAGHPILVNLKTGKPELRIHTWSDGGIVFERPDQKFAGDESGLRRIHRVNDTGTATEALGDPMGAGLDRELIFSLLNRVRSAD